MEPFLWASRSPPVTAITESESALSSSPKMVISRPASPSQLPTRMLATLRERLSMAPEMGTPNFL